MKRLKKFAPMIALNVASAIFFYMDYGLYSIIPASIYWIYFCYLNRPKLTAVFAAAAGLCWLMSNWFNIWIALIPGYVMAAFCMAAVWLLIKQHRETKASEALKIEWLKKAKEEIINEDGTPNFSKRLKLQQELDGILHHKSNKGIFKDKEGNVL